MDLYPQEFEVATIIEEVMTTVTALAHGNRNRLSVHCPQKLTTLYAEPMRARLILLSLVINRCQLCEYGEVALWLARERRNGRAGVRFAVSDTGIGMSAEHMENLFQEFKRAENSITHR